MSDQKTNINSLESFLSNQTQDPVISSNHVLSSLALMRDVAGDDADLKAQIKNWANAELKYIKAAGELISNNPQLKQKLRGEGIDQAISLATILKRRAMEKELHGIIDTTAQSLADSATGNNQAPAAGD